MPKVIVACTIGELGEFERSIMVVSCLFELLQASQSFSLLIHWQGTIGLQTGRPHEFAERVVEEDVPRQSSPRR